MSWTSRLPTARFLSSPRGFALLVGGSPAGLSPDSLRVLAQAASFSVAADSGAVAASFAGIPLDLIVGDMDSVTEDVLAGFEASGTELLRFSPVKDKTDLELAAAEVCARGFEALVMANSLGGRLDHALAAVGALSRGEVAATSAVSDSEAVFVCREGRHLLSDFSLRAGEEYSVISAGEGAVMSEWGVAYDADGLVLEPLSGRGVSNIVRDDDAGLEIHRGKALLITRYARVP